MPIMKVSRSARVGMIVADRGLSRAVVVAVAPAATGVVLVVLVRVVLVDRGMISAGPVEGLVDLTKIVAAPAEAVNFADRSPVAAAARKSGATTIGIVHRVRPSRPGRWW
jgi:hypothetical protein